MQNLLKAGAQLYKKPSFIYHLGSRTFKVFSPAGSSFKLAELQGNRGARHTTFWADQVVEVKPTLFYLEMKRGIPVLPDNLAAATKFTEDRLQQALTYPRQPINQAYDFAYLRKLENHHLEPGLLQQAEKLLSTVPLPQTSSHGDFHIGNMVYINQEIKIIDWSMFTSKGSFITDYIHFHNYKNAINHKESWTQAIVKEQPYLDGLALKLKVTSSQLRLAYAISRIAGEIAQKESLNRTTPREITKYNFVLKQIISKANEDIFQRYNSVV